MALPRRLFIAIAAAFCLLGVAQAVDVPSNVDFSFGDLPKTGDLMQGEWERTLGACLTRRRRAGGRRKERAPSPRRAAPRAGA